MTQYVFRTYRDRKKEYRWAFYAPNGRKIANSGEGYKRKSTMLNSIVSFANAIGKGEFSVVDAEKRRK